MIRFKRFLNELKIAKLYTMRGYELKPGEDLLSLDAQLGKKKAKQVYMKRWHTSDKKSNDIIKHLSNIHPGYVHLRYPPPGEDPDGPGKGIFKMRGSENITEPMRLFDVRPGRGMNPVICDKYSGDPHPMVKDRIQARYIRNVWDEKTKTWKRWN